MRWLSIIGLLLITRLVWAQTSSFAPEPPLASAHQQLLLVRSASWARSTGTLERYDRSESGEWVRVGTTVSVNLGRNGLAWGRGLHAMPESGPRKQEGDGKSPAGAFTLGSAFGAAAALPEGAANFPYLQTLASTYCVEDTRSPFYNQIIDVADSATKTWQKWSELRRGDGLFDWGVVVQQNVENPSRGAGSCVFLHLWRGPRRPTAGCTAMDREPLEAILKWLDPNAKPLLVQLPEATYETLREAWGLPSPNE